MSPTPASPDVVKASLKDIQVRPGIALQVRRLVEGASKTEAQLLGVVERRGLMVGPQGPEGEDTGLRAGEVCIVRGFTGQHEFSFIGKVLQTYTQPFVYALLTYPEQVDARQVRQSMRTRTSWPVTALASGQTVPGQLVDLSPQGAMIRTAAAVAPVGHYIQLQIHASVEGQPTTLQLRALVCHSGQAAEGADRFTGMAFEGVSPQDRLVLHYLTKTPAPG
ncbi:MAG: PilZ domain-containing protein [Hylemonella sp.]